ncbi:putative B3 domain-containing protein At2g27410 [Jatropha curcas]|uniref:putative B3 domain-containing protein At2g27410 n=1 Tax=Jatropha curcas TaxID=180498 RepID=UPI0018949DA6|nr:putative B3 domain-containing protein At2g27410 [Jatropha curcas]
MEGGDRLGASVTKRRRGSSGKDIFMGETYGNKEEKIEECAKEEERESKRLEKPKKSTKTKRVDFKKLGLEPPPDLPDEWKREIIRKGGTDTKLVIMKQIFKTDTSAHHDRFTIPWKQVKDHEFLTMDDRRKIDSPKDTFSVSLMEPCGHESELVLRRWNFQNKKSFSLALTTRWKEVLERNFTGMDEITIIQLWSFRVNGKLWFALIRVPKELYHHHLTDDE